MLKDMGQALDDFNEITTKNSSNVLKVRYGPGMYQMVTMHPDLSKILLKSGIEPKYTCFVFFVMVISFLFFPDPKSDVIYYPLLPWLGKGRYKKIEYFEKGIKLYSFHILI